MQMYDKFHRPLPTSYGEFKRRLHDLFPVIYDTKHMASNLKRVRRLQRLCATVNMV